MAQAPSYPIPPREDDGWAPSVAPNELHLVLRKHHARHRKYWKEVLEILDDNPEYASVPDETGSLPLHVLAAYGGRQEVVQKLVECNPSALRASNAASWLPLHLACESGHAAVAEELLIADPECIFCRDSDGMRPIERSRHIAPASDEASGSDDDEFGQIRMLLAMAEQALGKRAVAEAAGSAGRDGAAADDGGAARESVVAALERECREAGIDPDADISAAEAAAEDAHWKKLLARPKAHELHESDVLEVERERARILKRDGLSAHPVGSRLRDALAKRSPAPSNGS